MDSGAGWADDASAYPAYLSQRTGEMECGEDVDGASIVSSGDASEVFELAGEALDAIAKLIGRRVTRDGDGAASGRGDHGFGPAVGDETAHGVAVLGVIGDHAVGVQSVQ